MINNYLERQIKENFPYQPTLEQEIAVKSLSEFLLSTLADEVFILRGYAGTGKTSLVGALVKTMDQLQQKSVLLAPTGRAAKVFSAYAGHPAFTIHKKIYRQQSFSNELSNFSINDNLATNTLFIVDDPPVGEELSPALFADALKGYGLEVREIDLTQVVRQVQESGILWNATQLRQLIAEDDCYSLPKIKITGFPDIKLVPGIELIEELTNCYDHDGMDETIVVCRSNKRANLYNNGIRAQILWREDELNTGDMLMIAKNNYYWTEKYKEMDFIANGEIAVVRRVRRTREIYGFRFAEVTLRFPDQNDFELDANLLLDTLHSDSPALPKEDNDRLFYTVLEDYIDIPNKRDRMKKMKADPHYNALQVKYAYAITCHKAQGGQWQNVFLDQGYMTDEYLTPDYFRWLYTAFTRATKTLYLVNYPKEQVE
ncbi:MAG: ATP-dependent helicase [Bacteroides sp.]|nr:ATP-dependent helicase [Bacteroides sp.]